jgi:hypothetical protein
MEANNWKTHENRINIINNQFCIPHKLNPEAPTSRNLSNYLINSIKDENTMTICYTTNIPTEPDVISNNNIYAIATVKYIDSNIIEITCLCTNKELGKLNAGKFCLKQFFEILDDSMIQIKVVLETVQSIDSVVSTMYEKEFNMTKIDGSKHTHYLQFPRHISQSRGRSQGRYISQSQSRGRSQGRYISQSRGRSQGRYISQSQGRSQGRYISQSQGRRQSRGPIQSRSRSRSRSRDRSGGGKRTKRNNKKYH